MKRFNEDPYRQLIFYRTYSRWNPDKERRETWEEVVDRYMAFMFKNLGDRLSKRDYEEVHDAILQQEVMPSMRLLWSAGKAADRTNVTAYNCFSGKTTFVTRSGTKSFEDSIDEDVEVSTPDGWKTGHVYSFGRQPTVRVTLKH